MYLTWNNVALPDFIKVTAVTKTSVPTFDHTLVKVVGRMGFQYAGTVYGAQKVDIDYIFVEQPTIKLDDMPRYLANFFGLDAGELRIVGKPGYYYNAVLDPPADVSGIAFAGEGSISFNCWEGFAWSNTVFDTGNITISTSSTTTINNTGDLPTRPIISIFPSVAIQGFRLTNVTTGEVLIADTPQINTGVQVIIDMYREEVYLGAGGGTGSTSLMPYVSLNSTFFDLAKGSNVIKLDNPYGPISGTWKVLYQTKVF